MKKAILVDLTKPRQRFHLLGGQLRRNIDLLVSLERWCCVIYNTDFVSKAPLVGKLTILSSSSAILWILLLQS